MKFVLVSSSLFLLTSAAPAAAYLDPISGSIILQTLIGGFAAALVALRGFREKIMGVFRKSSDAESNEASE